MQVVEELDRLLAKHLDVKRLSEARHAVAGFIQDFERPVLPAPHERVAVAEASRKTAALVYDRIWEGMDPKLPPDMHFRGQSAFEFQSLLAATVGRYLLEAFPFDREPLQPVIDRLYELTLAVSETDPLRESGFAERISRKLAEAVSQTHGIFVTPVFSCAANRDRQYSLGDRECVVAAIKNIAIPSEEDLQWEQVVEFRRDEKTRIHLRKLTHWLDTDMVGKSWSYIEDDLAIRLDRYENALKKHGIRTVLGSLATTLDSKVVTTGTIATSSIALAGEPLLGALCGGAIIAGKIAVEVGLVLLDIDAAKASQPEVSFVAEVKRKVADAAA